MQPSTNPSASTTRHRLGRPRRAIAGGVILLLGLVVAGCGYFLAAEKPIDWPADTPLPFKEGGGAVPQDVMQKVYDEVKTPYKYGVVIRGEKGRAVDCPNIFRAGRYWYMMYVYMNVAGYETLLARSTDLLHWEKLGTILPFRKEGWDAWQADAGLALYDLDWEGRHGVQRYRGRVWATYIGGPNQGYEPDPLSIGAAWTDDPTAPTTWTRALENPIMKVEDPDARPFEARTLFKSSVIWDRKKALGYPFVMYYNARQAGPVGTERIGMAVSNDMLHWRRYGDGPVIENGERGISGDPQLVRMGDLWVMFYFGAFWRGGMSAIDTFACSYDMVHWTKWNGPHLIEPSEPFDKTFAHKPWTLKHDGVVYHYYCAVGEGGRTIALATSKDLGKSGDVPPPPPPRRR